MSEVQGDAAAFNGVGMAAAVEKRRCPVIVRQRGALREIRVSLSRRRDR